MIPDKRDECGCHKTCSWLIHDCAVPCVWPNCLSEEEHDDLAAEVLRELTGGA